MQSHARLVIIGAGIVGCSVAYHLTKRGWRDVVVVDQGPLFDTGGSSSHAPGLVFQTNASKLMTTLAMATVELYSALELDREPCWFGVGSLEVAYTEERWRDLHRKAGFCQVVWLGIPPDFPSRNWRPRAAARPRDNTRRVSRAQRRHCQARARGRGDVSLFPRPRRYVLWEYDSHGHCGGGGTRTRCGNDGRPHCRRDGAHLCGHLGAACWAHGG